MAWFAAHAMPMTEADWAVMVTMLPLGGMIGTPGGPLLKQLPVSMTCSITSSDFQVGFQCSVPFLPRTLQNVPIWSWNRSLNLRLFNAGPPY